MKSKKILDNICMLLIIITIVTFNLIIGANEKALPILPMCIILACLFSLLIIKKIKYREKLIKSKIDIAVSLFMAVLFLPLLFRTYCSFEGCIEFILKYFFVYTIYLLIRNSVDTKNKFNILICTVVVSSLIFIILGIDIQHSTCFDWLIKKLDLKYSSDYRFSSTFGYANAVSIYVLFCIFLAINRIENLQKNCFKIFYFLYIILGTYIIYISYSRVVLILYVLSITIYFGIKIYNKIKHNKKLIRNIAFIGIIIICSILSYLFITIKISKPYIADETFKLRKKIETNTQYQFEFDINTIKSVNETTNPQIVILEVNENLNETEIGRITLDSNKNTYNIIVKTSENSSYLKFKLINENNDKITINHFYINNEEHIFSYKYIPSVISRLITSFSLQDDSIILRKQYYTDCLKIAKDSLIIGHGGNTWKILSRSYSYYDNPAKETHSYFFELLISYGIVGAMVFLLIVVMFCKNIIKELINNKEKRKLKLSAFIGLMIIILYNLIFDFGMSFIVIILIVFAFIALLQFENDEKTNLKCIDIISLITIGAVFIILLNSCIAKYCIKDVKTKAKFAPYVAKYNLETMDQSNIEDIKKYMQKEPYRSQNDMYKYYWNALYRNRNTFSQEQLEKYINFGTKTFETKKCISLTAFNTIMRRVEIMKDSIIKLNEMQNTEENIKRIKEQMKKEYKIYSKYLQDTNENNEDELSDIEKLNKYKSILEEIDIEID